MSTLAVVVAYVFGMTIAAFVMGWTRQGRREAHRRSFCARYPTLGTDAAYVERDFWAFAGGDESVATFVTVVTWPVSLPIVGISAAIRYVGALGERRYELNRQRHADMLSAEAEVDRIVKELGL